MAGKCPKCEKPVMTVKGDPVTINVSVANQLKGVSYSCANCSTVLGVEIDPLAVRTEIVAHVVDALQAR